MLLVIIRYPILTCTHIKHVLIKVRSLAVNCNLVDCRDIISSECGGADILLAEPSIDRCCDICGERTCNKKILHLLSLFLRSMFWFQLS